MGKKKQCSNSGCTKPGVYKCAGCSRAMYCSKECQVGHWDTHKIQCKSKTDGGSSPKSTETAPPTFSTLTVKQLKHVIRSKTNNFEDKERKSIISAMMRMDETEPLIELAEKYIQASELPKLLSTLPDKTGAPMTNMGGGRRGGQRMMQKEQEIDITKATPRQLLEQAAMLRRNPDLVRKTQPSMAGMTNAELADAAKQMEDMARDPSMMKEFRESWSKMTPEEREMMKNITPEQREQVKNLTPEQKEMMKNITPEQRKEMMKMAHLNPAQKQNLQIFQEGLQGSIDQRWVDAVASLFKQCPGVFKTMVKTMFPDSAEEQINPYLDWLSGLDEYYLRMFLHMIRLIQAASRPVMNFYNQLDSWTFGNAKHIALLFAGILVYIFAVIALYVFRFFYRYIVILFSFLYNAYTNTQAGAATSASMPGGVHSSGADEVTGAASSSSSSADEFEF